jgi:hypothetical protein
MEAILEAVFSTWSMPRLYNEQTSREAVSEERTCVEAGSNTFTVTLRVVGGDENGSLKLQTVKYGRESQSSNPEPVIISHGAINMFLILNLLKCL